jgi:hypothetical protein
MAITPGRFYRRCDGAPAENPLIICGRILPSCSSVLAGVQKSHFYVHSGGLSVRFFPFREVTPNITSSIGSRGQPNFQASTRPRRFFDALKADFHSIKPRTVMSHHRADPQGFCSSCPTRNLMCNLALKLTSDFGTFNLPTA